MATDSDEIVHSWSVEYAKSGRSKCQATGELIAQGAMRIGKEVDSTFKPGMKMFVWHTVEGLFASFRKGAEEKPRITSTDELVGFDTLKVEDQESISEQIESENQFRGALAEVDADATRLEHTKDGGVFWSVVQTGNTTRVKWGKSGEAGNVSEKEHKDEGTATKFVEKKIKEKLKGGYTHA